MQDHYGNTVKIVNNTDRVIEYKYLFLLVQEKIESKYSEDLKAFIQNIIAVPGAMRVNNFG